MIFEYTLGSTLLSAFILAAALLPFGTAVIALGSEMAGQMENKLADKLAQQITRLGCIAVAAVALASILLAGLWSFGPERTFRPETVQFLLFRIIPVILLATVFFLVYLSTWKKLKESKPAHASLGAISAALMGIFLFLLLASIMTASPLYDLRNLPGVRSVVYPLLLQWLFFALTAGGTASLLFLLIRRNRDDFGRDYYRYALRACSKWVLISTLFGFVPCAWIGWLLRPNLRVLPLILPGAVSALAALCLCTFVLVLIRTAQPLRYKGIILTAQFVLIIFFASRILVQLEILNMVPETIKTITCTGQWSKLLF
ncbi:MAG: hypothetical protein ACLFSY_02960 [Desulfonatronovibrionaceae bacterium]